MKINFVKKHGFYLGLGAIALVNVLFLLSLAGIRSLWHDDIYQLFFSWNRSFADSMDIVRRTDLTPPLWNAVAFLWLKIAPYGTAWVKLPSILLVGGAIYLFGITCKELFGKHVALFGAALFALSPYVAIECSYSFRAYGLYMFASVFILYAYIRRLRNPCIPNRLLFCLGVFLVAFTHYFGALLCVFLGMADLILAIRKKQKKSFFVEYVTVCVLELFWLITQMTSIASALSDFWPPLPGFFSCLALLKAMLHRSYALLILFLILAIRFVVKQFKAVKKDGASAVFEDKTYLQVICLLIPILMIALIAVYCNVYPRSSVWVYRYFFCTYPLLMLFLVSTLSELFGWLGRAFSSQKAKRFRVTSLCLLFGFCLIHFTWAVSYDQSVEFEPFEQAAQTVMAQPEIQNGEEVLIYITVDCGDGWKYYLSQNNTVNIDHIKLMDNIDYNSDKEELLSSLSQAETVYLYGEHMFLRTEEERLTELKAFLSETHTEIILDVERDIYKYVKKSS